MQMFHSWSTIIAPKMMAPTAAHSPIVPRSISIVLKLLPGLRYRLLRRKSARTRTIFAHLNGSFRLAHLPVNKLCNGKAYCWMIFYIHSKYACLCEKWIYRETSRIGLIECGSCTDCLPGNFQAFERWRLNMYDIWLQLWRPQRFNCLIMRTNYTNAPWTNDGLYTLHRCAIQMAFIFATFDKLARQYVRIHAITRYKQVLTARNFTGSYWPRCI